MPPRRRPPPPSVNLTEGDIDALAQKSLIREVETLKSQVKYGKQRTDRLSAEVTALKDVLLVTSEKKQEFQEKMEEANAMTKSQQTRLTHICDKIIETFQELEGEPCTRESLGKWQRIVDEAGDLKNRYILAAKNELKRQKESLVTDFRQDIPAQPANSTASAPTREDLIKGAEAAEVRWNANKSSADK